MAVGLAMRYGAKLQDNLYLSDECWKIIVGEGGAHTGDELPTDEFVTISGKIAVEKGEISETLKGKIIRHGITTIIPEVLFQIGR